MTLVCVCSALWVQLGDVESEKSGREGTGALLLSSFVSNMAKLLMTLTIHILTPWHSVMLQLFIHQVLLLRKDTTIFQLRERLEPLTRLRTDILLAEWTLHHQLPTDGLLWGNVIDDRLHEAVDEGRVVVRRRTSTNVLYRKLRWRGKKGKGKRKMCNSSEVTESST